MSEQMSLPAEGMAENVIDDIRRLGVRLKALTQEIEQAQSEISELQAIKRQISEVTLPELMESAQITELVLIDGTKITLRPFYNAKIPPPLTQEAYQWLEEHNHDGIITSGFSIKFPKSERDQANRARDALRELGIPVVVEDSIHHATLKSFVREQIEADAELPRELFGVYEGKIVTFK